MATELGEGWAKGWEVFESTGMNFLPPTFWVVEEQAEGHVSRCHLMNRYSAGSESQR